MGRTSFFRTVFCCCYGSSEEDPTNEEREPLTQQEESAPTLESLLAEFDRFAAQCVILNSDNVPNLGTNANALNMICSRFYRARSQNPYFDARSDKIDEHSVEEYNYRTLVAQRYAVDKTPEQFIISKFKAAIAVHGIDKLSQRCDFSSNNAGMPSAGRFLNEFHEQIVSHDASHDFTF